MSVDRVIATPAGLALIEQLRSKHGPRLMFYQSGGCCDNSAPNCYIEGELTLSPSDVYLGSIGMTYEQGGHSRGGRSILTSISFQP